MNYFGCFKTLLTCLFIISQFCIFGQSWKWEMGNTYTQFDFVNSSGNSANFIKPKSGLSLGFSFNAPFLDTTSFLGESNKKATYFKQHNLLAKSLHILKYELGVCMNQFNAAGETQGNTFSYETNFVGINLGLGPEITLPLGISLSAQGRLSVFKMLQGTQMINGKYFSLENEEMFATNKLLFGFSVEMIKKVKNGIWGFVSFNQMKTLFSSNNGKQMLHINPTVISLGIQIKTK